jgi:superfamily I DNA and RNA helicase
VLSASLVPGEHVDIERPTENSPNRVDDYYSGAEQLIAIARFDTWNEEVGYVAKSISQLVSVEKVRPEDIVMISLTSGQVNASLCDLQRELNANGVKSIIPGLSGIAASEFARSDYVTLAGARRAKGNEAAVVYIVAFEGLYRYADAFENRNMAFTSISRSKAWVRITGSGEKMKQAEQEARRILADIPHFRFRFPDAPHQFLDEAESMRRKQEVREAKKAGEALLGAHEEVLGDLDPEVRKELLRRLRKAEDG